MIQSRIFFHQSLFSRPSQLHLKARIPAYFNFPGKWNVPKRSRREWLDDKLYTVYNIPGELHGRPLASHERGTSNNLRALSAISGDKAGGYCSRRKEKKKKRKKKREKRKKRISMFLYKSVKLNFYIEMDQ